MRQQPLAPDLRPRLELRLPGFLGPEHDAHRRGLSDPHSRRRQRRRVVHRLLRGICAVAVRYRGTAAGYGLLCSGVPDHTGLHGRHGRGGVVYRPRARRQGAQRDRRLSLGDRGPATRRHRAAKIMAYHVCKAGFARLVDGRGTLSQVEQPVPGYFPVIGFASRLASV